MAKSKQDLDCGIKKMLAFNDNDTDVKTNIKVASTRPVWEANAATINLVEITKFLAKELGTAHTYVQSVVLRASVIRTVRMGLILNHSIGSALQWEHHV